MSIVKTPIAVLGAGSWGTALALLLARNQHIVRLWGHDPQHMQSMAEARCNTRYLPKHPFPENLQVDTALQATLDEVQDVLIAVPSHAFCETLIKLKDYWQPHMRLVWATKGLDATGQLLHEVAIKILGDNIPMAILAGPSFAQEVAQKLPTAVTLAAQDQAFAKNLIAYFHNTYFRVYTSTDMIGVQVGGFVKNILAVAAGIADGLGFGANARSALLTRGLAEMQRLGLAMGARAETFIGLAGVGDLILTGTDNQSRNRRFGLALGQGIALAEALASIVQVVEAVNNALQVYRLARQYQVDMPIVEQVYYVLHEHKSPKQAAQQLLTRAPSAEI
jgi:glycerol-3-phosphate dehydrogenase (NAD(P)+)